MPQQELTLEQRLKNIEQSTLAELDKEILVLVQTKEQKALAMGIIAGTVVAAFIGDKHPFWAIAAGLGSSLLVTKLLAPKILL